MVFKDKVILNIRDKKMDTKRFISLIILSLALPALSYAQLKEQADVNMAQALKSPGKLDGLVSLIGLNPDNFSMNHSYSLSVGSIGGHGFNQGLYLNTMSYRLSNMAMYLQLGVSHQPFGSPGDDLYQSKAQAFVAGAGIAYKLSEKTALQLEIRQMPASHYYYSPYSSPFRQSGFGRSWMNDDRRLEFKE